MSQVPFPRLAENWETTRASLHAYCKAVDTLPQTHIPQHPLWWNISLNPRPDGLETDNIALPGGGVMNGRLDMRSHEIVLDASTGWHTTFDLREGRTGTEMADAVIAAVTEVGLEGTYARKDFENDEPREYDESAVAPYWTALNSANAVFATHRRTLDYTQVGPIQFWPHGFDIAFEWFGKAKVAADGEEAASQLNLGSILPADRTSTQIHTRTRPNS